MNEPPIHYAKLPGPGVGWVGRARLWLAEDHVLEVNSTLFAERYHRYFLRDIRSVVAQRTKTGFYWNVALVILAALGLASGGAFYWVTKNKIVDGDVQITGFVLSGMFAGLGLILLLALFINILLGPTCRFYIQTTAGSRLLAAPTRLRRAQRLLARLVPHIESVQSAPQT